MSQYIFASKRPSLPPQAAVARPQTELLPWQLNLLPLPDTSLRNELKDSRYKVVKENFYIKSFPRRRRPDEDQVGLRAASQ